MVVLGIADHRRGIVIPAYLWAALGIILGGLLIGLILRRTPWGLVWFLPFVILGLVVFGGSSSSLHDGTGNQVVTPIAWSGMHDEYRLALGDLTLDLTALPPSDVPRHFDVVMAAGQTKILIGTSANIRVNGDVHFGAITVSDNLDRRALPVTRFGDGSDVTTGGVNVAADDRAGGPGERCSGHRRCDPRRRKYRREVGQRVWAARRSPSHGTAGRPICVRVVSLPGFSTESAQRCVSFLPSPTAHLKP